jgi:hypothetical protein
MLPLPAKNQPWKSKQELSIAIGIDDQATIWHVTTKSLLLKRVIVKLTLSHLHAKDTL